MVQQNCRTKQLTPKYIRIKVRGNSLQNKRTTTAKTKHRFNKYVHLLVQIIYNKSIRICKTPYKIFVLSILIWFVFKKASE
jgi:hypothetical protein